MMGMAIAAMMIYTQMTMAHFLPNITIIVSRSPNCRINRHPTHRNRSLKWLSSQTLLPFRIVTASPTRGAARRFLIKGLGGWLLTLGVLVFFELMRNFRGFTWYGRIF